MDEALNYRMTGGSFNKRVRVLSTMHLVFNETAQRFVVKNDSDGRTYASGFATVDEAVKSCEREDMRRMGLLEA
jgi:hypothetical protein